MGTLCGDAVSYGISGSFMGAGKGEKGMGRNKKKVRLIPVIPAILLLLTGCSARELEDREFVEAMEIEWNGETLMGGFGSFLVEGNSVEELQKQYQNRIPEYLDLGHVKVLILGSRLLSDREVQKEVLTELEKKPVLARNILVLSHEYQNEESFLEEMKEKGIVPGEYLSDLYKNNPDKRQNSTATLGDLLSMPE